MPRYSSEENRHRRMDTDTDVAKQEDEQRARRDRLRKQWGLDDVSDATLDAMWDRIAEGRSPHP